MRIATQANHRGFAQVDLIVIVATLAMMFGVLAPAVQDNREQARRDACQDQLRKLARAFHEHHEARGGFPPHRTQNPARHGYGVNILPFIGRTDLYEQYQFDKPFYDPENEPIVRLPLADFQCPAVPEPNRLIKMGLGNEDFGTQGVAGDYFVNHFLNAMGFPDGNRHPPALLGDGQFQPMSKITDGTSCTTLIHEQAGRPDHYILREKQPDASKHTLANWWGPWTAWLTFQYQGYSADGQSAGWDCSVNCNNAQGIYSFHQGGANAAFCDGSVRFLADSIPVELVFALGTRDGAEVVSSDDY